MSVGLRCELTALASWCRSNLVTSPPVSPGPFCEPSAPSRAGAVPSLYLLSVRLALGDVPQLGFLLGLATAAPTQVANLPPTAKPSLVLNSPVPSHPPLFDYPPLCPPGPIPVHLPHPRLPPSNSPRLDPSKYGTKQTCLEIAKVMLKTGGAFSNFVPEASAPLWSASLEIHSFLSH